MYSHLAPHIVETTCSLSLSPSLEIVLAIFGIYVPNMQDGDIYVTARTTVKWFLPLQYKFLTVAFEMAKCAEYASPAVMCRFKIAFKKTWRRTF